MKYFPSPADFKQARTTELLEHQLKVAMFHYEAELQVAMEDLVDLDEIRVNVYKPKNEHPEFHWAMIKALKKKGWDGNHIQGRYPGDGKKIKMRLTPIEGFGDPPPKRWWQF